MEQHLVGSTRHYQFKLLFLHILIWRLTASVTKVTLSSQKKPLVSGEKTRKQGAGHFYRFSIKL